KPPRLEADERRTLMALLQFQRESLVRKVTGVDDVAARYSPVGSGTSLLWLVRHVADAEATWVLRRFAGRQVATDQGVDAGDSLEAACAAHRAMWDRVDAEVDASASLEERCRAAGDPPVTLRWVLMHLLEETARHAGHADILRELVDGSTGR
ncbi:MAG TPA: DinB family protein, partial [Acidimicrobiales bacterium]|nr:DinB family protein [Acidimicrobiales bacterium]